MALVAVTLQVPAPLAVKVLDETVHVVVPGDAVKEIAPVPVPPDVVIVSVVPKTPEVDVKVSAVCPALEKVNVAEALVAET